MVVDFTVQVIMLSVSLTVSTGVTGILRQSVTHYMSDWCCIAQPGHHAPNTPQQFNLEVLHMTRPNSQMKHNLSV